MLKTMDEWCSSESLFGRVLFKNFVSNMDMRSSVPSASLQMTPSPVEQLTLWREGISSWGIWTGLRIGPVPISWGPTRLSAKSCDHIDSNPSEKYLGSLEEKLDMTQQWALAPRNPTRSWDEAKAVWQAGQGRQFCPSRPLLWSPIWGTTSNSWAPNIRRKWTCWSESREGPWRKLERDFLQQFVVIWQEEMVLNRKK